ncbi:GNAT family N-acetyltransferase [Nostoc sp. CHAB 5844]|nr:GNAT family N-acetyltransferase [Nostoc sp. CHAB 5844]
MHKIEVPKNIEIKRDFEAEKQNPKYTYHKMCFNDEIVGIANYRLFQNQASYWYIDEFLISKQFREQGYGTYLLNYITEKMWNVREIPIHIYPTSQQIPKEYFIKWLIRRGFVEEPPLATGQVFCILHYTSG